MHLPTRFALPLLGFALAAAASPAQQVAPAGQPASNRIVLDVVVTPKSGAPVTGLQQQNFTVLDNGVAQPIASFAAFTRESPVEVVLLIDAVNTTFRNIAFERRQIGDFLKADGGRLTYPTALAVFTDTSTQIQPDFSTDGNALNSALDQYSIGLRDIRRDSEWGAQERLELSLNALHTLAVKEAARPGRKIILWVSPGWPLLSGVRVDLDTKQEQQIYRQILGISTTLRLGGITLYSIDSLGAGEDPERTDYYQNFLKAVTKPNQVQIGNLGLQVLAVQSGGLAVGPSNDTASLLRRCMADIAAYYELSFDPPPAEHPDEYHALQIKINQPGLTARTRSGYYAEP